MYKLYNNTIVVMHACIYIYMYRSSRGQLSALITLDLVELIRRLISIFMVDHALAIIYIYILL